MQSKSMLDTFIASTNYTDPVDIKKLKFIFSAIERYAHLRSKQFEDLRVLEVGCGRGGITFPLASLGCQVIHGDAWPLLLIDTRALGVWPE